MEEAPRAVCVHQKASSGKYKHCKLCQCMPFKINKMEEIHKQYKRRDTNLEYKQEKGFGNMMRMLTFSYFFTLRSLKVPSLLHLIAFKRCLT